MRRRTFLICLVAILAAACALRTVWLTADPPTAETAGIVWHDEGAWAHNARNKALWGQWQTDQWNPMFLAPVFTGLEYMAFAAFGVGTWQARTVPVASGLLAVAALALGLSTVVGRRAAVAGAILLTTNFFFVMWNRAALMESTMTAALVVSWAAYALSARRRVWGIVAGAACVLAFFTKASAAFFVVALTLDAVWTWRTAGRSSGAVRGAQATLAGLAVAGVIAAIVFVVPFWSEFQFYNWQMSVVRKPDYAIGALLDRASWLPIIHHVFTRMWLVLVAAGIAALAMALHWRNAPPAGRLLVLWVLLGLAELILHDSGNERRYVMLVPAFIGLAAWLCRDPAIDPAAPGTAEPSASRWMLAPVLLLFSYLVAGGLLRVLSLEQIYAHELRFSVRLSAAAAVLLTCLMLWHWTRVVKWLTTWRPAARLIAVAAALMVIVDLAQFSGWARGRTDLNYRASIAVGDALPPETAVHGKLANGLSLENRIRPVFVGRGFGNYEDRLDRQDIRYLLTYISPRLGYEGAVILDVLDHLPAERAVATWPVQETREPDVVALFDKFGQKPIPVP